MTTQRMPACKRNYREFKGYKLEKKLEDVKTGVFGNENVFTTPPETIIVVEALLLEYAKRRGEYENGGLNQKLAYIKYMTEVIAMLDKFAIYVETLAKGDATVIKMGGFEVAWDNTPPLPKTVIGNNTFVVSGTWLKRVESAPGRMMSDCDKQSKDTTYIGILSEDVPLPDGVTVDAEFNVIFPGGFTAATRVNISKQRKKFWSNLKHNADYYLYYIAVKSKTVSIMSQAVVEQCV